MRPVGGLWDEANVAALAFTEETGGAYFHPCGDAAIVAGQGTVGREIIEDAPDLDLVLVAIDLIARCADTNMVLLTAHFPDRTAGRLESDSDGFRFCCT